jgi:hypothetical protein
MSEPGFIGLMDYPDFPTSWPQDIFIFLRVSSCNFVANFLVIFIGGYREDGCVH